MKLYTYCCTAVLLFCLNVQPIAAQTLLPTTADTVTVVAVGDIMMGTIYPNRQYLPPNEDCSGQLQPVSHILRSGDITFGNLEGVLIDSNETAKQCKNSQYCYTFGMPTKFVHCLTDAGFNLLSLANNHVNDFGERGRNTTMETLKKAGIRFAGLEASCPVDTFTIKGVKYGFTAFAPNNGTMNLRDIAAAEAVVRQLAAQCQVVIVSFHGGAEGSSAQHVTRKTEMYIGENRGNVYEFAHRMIDAGADILLGHGPHVTRAIEVYKNRFIAYSMGNFCTYERVNVNGVNGLAPIFKIYIDTEGKFLKGEIISTYQEKHQPPRVDEQQRVLQVIRNLTKTDFPEMSSVINIDDKGVVTMKD
ncbi:MAG: CapA family protein [Bacteroidales bacterium]|nr:CapA family protein [Bacteroidales bacterium]MCL2133598.1 CapA family protein [Bacteroidales bacterium]